MRPRLVISGTGGRLGAALARDYAEEFEVIALARADMDLADPAAPDRVLGPLRFDAMIHCAALTNVDYCETHRGEAFRINAESVGRIGEICRDKSARLIGVSTDYVFAGDTPGLRSEEDPAEPISVYGESKHAGELALAAASPEHLAVRVSWVFGPDRPSFLDMLAARALENDRLEAIDGKFSCPTYAADVSGWLRPLLLSRAHGGILHLCNRGETTWREYGAFALNCLRDCGVPVKTVEVAGIPIAEMKNFVARRPIHTAMATDRFTEWTGIRPRLWRDAVADYVHTHLAARLLGR